MIETGIDGVRGDRIMLSIVDIVITRWCVVHGAGLPIGVQLVGKWWSEAKLLELAAVLEDIQRAEPEVRR